MNVNSIRDLSDEQLLIDVEAAAADERDATVRMIGLLSEVDARRLYLQLGYSSLFVYCTKCLHLSEHAAYGRIEAARAARKFPLVLDRLADGSITLTTICLLSNHLTVDNHQHLLDAALHKSRREVEEEVAAIRPMPAIASAIRKLPQPKAATAVNVVDELIVAGSPAVAASSTTRRGDFKELPERLPAPPIVRPLAPERYKVQFTISPDTHRKLRSLQDLMRHRIPDGDIAKIFDRAITLLLREVERRSLAIVEHPRSTSSVSTSASRHIPAAVKREVWARDDGRCAFVGRKGRCDERGFLEFHHVTPFAEGGATTTENLQLRCAAHNAHEAREHFGFAIAQDSANSVRTESAGGTTFVPDAGK